MSFDFGDLMAIEPSTGGGSYELLPKGDYRLGINDVSEETLTNKGGSYVYIEYAVVDGDHEGATFRVFYNVKNNSAKTVEIAWKELAALARAIGVPGGQSERMLGKTLYARVGIKPPNVGTDGKQYGESNKIDKYYPLGEEPGTPPVAATAAPAPLRAAQVVAQTARPATVGTTAARPWAKRA